ncbi:MAG: NAD-dependent epimerase/dehydratase family protein [Firmicutes bacterium]|nr:NAD-dependent epimerase/dehydratase family protein [Bacillota bacterium]
MNYLITGITGHLGNTIARKLLEQGASVRGLALANDKIVDQLPSEIEIFRGNIADKESMRPFFTIDKDEETVLIHSAGIVTIASKFDQAVRDVNVGGTKNILDLCEEYGIKKLIYVSSVHAIPERPHGEVITESSDFSPEKVVGLYAKTKAEATALVLEAATRGLHACVVHPSGIMGPYDYGRGHLTQLLIDYSQGRLVAGVKGGYDFVDVRDVAEGILACSKKGRSGEGYILSNRYFTVQEMLEMFHKVTGKKRVKAVIPMWIAKLTAPLSESYYRILKQPPLYTPYSLFTLTSNSRFSHEKASRELGYKVTPIEKTVRDMVDWLKNQKRI